MAAGGTRGLAGLSCLGLPCECLLVPAGGASLKALMARLLQAQVGAEAAPPSRSVSVAILRLF